MRSSKSHKCTCGLVQELSQRPDVPINLDPTSGHYFVWIKGKEEEVQLPFFYCPFCGGGLSWICKSFGNRSGKASKPLVLSSINLWSSFPVEIRIRVPFTNFSFDFGCRTLKSARRRASQHPSDPDARMSLAASLLSQEPLTAAHVQEAVIELEAALGLLPQPGTYEYNSQTRAMGHKFLGDALLALGRTSEARQHWQRAIDLDPVRPPYGFSGPALEQLQQHTA